jgi:hypothetical protein
LLADYIESGVPGICVVRAKPRVALFIDAGGARFGAYVELIGDTSLPPSPLLEITVALVRVEGAPHLEVATSTRSLYRDFYLLLGELIGAVVHDGAEPVAALLAALDRWQNLLRMTALLSEERQIGLFGELWLLERLLPYRGAAALDAWVGPAGQPHDFRFGNTEIEVKTTSSNRRTHTINGLAQLMPSQDCSLFLLSLHMTAAGAGGRTLAELVDGLDSTVSRFDGGRLRLKSLLDATGFRAVDAPHYRTRRRIGGQPRLIAVEAGCPRLTRHALSNLPSGNVPDRILDASYQIDVEGLGYTDGDPNFLAILLSSPSS